ncbi:hypothetical protein NTCA1_54760 [Novosphingobium sp. TCA1]|nr:hypothetical protein NTCA1_54760 [Novosphingobium sp. TCA1]
MPAREVDPRLQIRTKQIRVSFVYRAKAVNKATEPGVLTPNVAGIDVSGRDHAKSPVEAPAGGQMFPERDPALSILFDTRDGQAGEQLVHHRPKVQGKIATQAFVPHLVQQPGHFAPDTVTMMIGYDRVGSRLLILLRR